MATRSRHLGAAIDRRRSAPARMGRGLCEGGGRRSEHRAWHSSGSRMPTAASLPLGRGRGQPAPGARPKRQRRTCRRGGWQARGEAVMAGDQADAPSSEELAIKEILGRTGLVRNTVRPAIRSDKPPRFRCPPAPRSSTLQGRDPPADDDAAVMRNAVEHESLAGEIARDAIGVQQLHGLLSLHPGDHRR